MEPHARFGPVDSSPRKRPEISLPVAGSHWLIEVRHVDPNRSIGPIRECRDPLQVKILFGLTAPFFFFFCWPPLVKHTVAFFFFFLVAGQLLLGGWDRTHRRVFVFGRIARKGKNWGHLRNCHGNWRRYQWVRMELQVDASFAKSQRRLVDSTSSSIHGPARPPSRRIHWLYHRNPPLAPSRTNPISQRHPWATKDVRGKIGIYTQ